MIRFNRFETELLSFMQAFSGMLVLAMNETIIMNHGLLIIHDASQTIEYSAVSSVLDLVVSITQSDAAHLYWMDQAAYELRMVSASPTPEDGLIPRVSLQFSTAARNWLEGVAPVAVVAAGGEYCGCFPEMAAFGVQGLVAAPLRAHGGMAGIVTLSRKDTRAFGAAEMEALAKVGDALMAAMKDFEREGEVEGLRARLQAARRENSQLEKKLAERKLVERAKGLLQVQYGWSEEDAYYHLRRTSRQSRTPMAVIAQRVIDLSSAKEVERLSA